MPRVLAHMAASLKRLVGTAAGLLSLEAAAKELKALYWALHDAPDFVNDAQLTARAHLLARSLAAAAEAGNLGREHTEELRACATALASWPVIEEPFDGQVYEGPLTRETAAVVALTSMRRAEAAARTARPLPRPRPSGPVRLRPT
jgi:hypothetical protein